MWMAVLLLAFVGWMLIWRHPASSARQECARRYANARTLSDTLRIDAQSSGAGTKGGAWNCGMLRRVTRSSPPKSSLARGATHG